MDSETTSLKELSYNNIVDNFSRHTYAYATTEDETLKRNLDFLQRVYTDSLLEDFSEKYILYEGEKQHFFNFIFNENLKQLIIGLHLVCFCDVETFLQKAIPIAQNLEGILIKECRSEEMKRYIQTSKELFSRATNVVQVDFPQTCNDEIIKVIALSCPRLKSFDINNSFVTGEGMKTLFLNTNGTIRTTSTLQTLDIGNIPLEMKDVASLVQNIPTLEEVKYSEMPAVIEYLYNSDEKGKIVKYNLQTLDFTYSRTSKITDHLNACVTKCPKVKKIKIKVSKAEHLELVSLFLKLEHLEVNNEKSFLDTQFNFLNFNSLLDCIGNGFKYLNVHGLSLSISVLLGNCPNLEYLDLSGICYQDFDMNSKNLLRQLHTVEFGWIDFRNLNNVNSVMKLLNSSPILENLYLYNCDFNESGITSKLLDFSAKCNLKYLYFGHTEVGINFLEEFMFRCSSLQTLTLDSCKYIRQSPNSPLRKTAEVIKKKINILFTPEDTSTEESDSNHSSDFDN